jgi:hypothetical protein
MTDKQFKTWKLAKKLSEELDKMGLGYVWQDPQVNSMRNK